MPDRLEAVLARDIADHRLNGRRLELNQAVALLAIEVLVLGVSVIVLVIGARAQFQPMRKLLVAPFELHAKILQLIGRERDNARRGLPARIIAKINSLAERQVIEAMYEASQAGVEIDLIVRGVCCLRPGLKGLSENIRVRSIVDRFLEHALIFALIRIKDRAGMIAVLKDQNPSVRRAALIALDQMDGGELSAEMVTPLLLAHSG